MIYLIDLTWLCLLAPGLTLALWARLRLGAVRRQLRRQPAPAGVTGQALAAALLDREGVSIQAADGPFATAYDPDLRTLRLAREVAEGSTFAELGRAAQAAGLARLALERPWLGRAEAAARFLGGLAALTAWIVIAAGVVLEVYRLLLAGLVLFDAVVLLGLATVPIGRHAAGLALDRLSGALGGEDEATRAVCDWLDVAPWLGVAAIVTGAPWRGITP